MDEQAIMIHALSIIDEEERQNFLLHACGDDNDLLARIKQAMQVRTHTDLDLQNVTLESVPNDHPETTKNETSETARGILALLKPSVSAESLGLLGSYDVLEVLGEGGFGVVFKALDNRLRRMVAIKVLSPQLAMTSPPRKRFLREARAAAKIRHENVVAVYDVAEEPLPYLVMEFIPGTTLQQEINRVGPLPLEDVLNIGRQIAAGLAAAHELGISHRDIKPGNILIEKGLHPRVKLTDFGLARTADDASLTQSGVVSGTPLYMSPEQAIGTHIDHRADLFSLGSVLYVMCTGHPPFRANNSIAVLKRVVEDTPRSIRQVIPELPEWLDLLIGELHEKSPELRIQTARTVAEYLASCEARLGVKEMPATSDFKAFAVPKSTKDSRRFAWTFGAGMIICMLGLLEYFGVMNLRGWIAQNDEHTNPVNAKNELKITPSSVATVDNATTPAKTNVDTTRPKIKKWNDKPIFISGEWKIVDDELSQLSKSKPALLLFGDRDTTDYDFQCEIKHTQLEHSVSLVAQAVDAQRYVYAEYGGFGNTLVDLEYAQDRGFKRLGVMRKSVPQDRWVPVCLKVRGREIEVFLDDQLLIHAIRKPDELVRGYIGFRTWDSAGKFRNVRVLDLEGNILWEGLPRLPDAENEVK